MSVFQLHAFMQTKVECSAIKCVVDMQRLVQLCSTTFGCQTTIQCNGKQPG